ncbi:MAG: tetratricopeptide repeat protein, partial [Gammaproteobacteria bacterium]|nr:tetratricopeptide repeat protein [Gammaproteobacteria bacterium]
MRVASPKIVSLVLVVLMLGACERGVQKLQLDEQDIAANNRGVGLMGYFDYEGARQVFADLALKHPDWQDLQVNLAIATLNRQQAGDEKTALEIVERVLAAEPEHQRARYVHGLLNLNAGEAEQALASFQMVADADPHDAYAAYYTALTQSQVGDTEAALASYQRALNLDPYLRSAYYGAFQALQRLGRRDAAREMLTQFQRLADNPQARLAEFKYTRMG